MRDLLCHRSGLPDHAGDLMEDMGYPAAEILRRLRYQPPSSSFRAGYAYNNFGYSEAAYAAAKGMGADNTKAQENNFTLNGSKELGVEVTFPELARICLAENDRRLGVYDPRLIRPKFVPAMMRLALKFAGKPKPAPQGAAA